MYKISILIINILCLFSSPEGGTEKVTYVLVKAQPGFLQPSLHHRHPHRRGLGLGEDSGQVCALSSTGVLCLLCSKEIYKKIKINV